MPPNNLHSPRRVEIAVHFEDIFFGDGCEGISRRRMEAASGGGGWRRRGRLDVARAAEEELTAQQL